MRLHRQRAFTLIELLVVIAIVAIVLTLGVPQFQDYILVQRLKSVSSQLTTDLMLARSEAVSRSTFMRVTFDQDSTNSCYTLYTTSDNATRCDCKLGPGAACSLVSTLAQEVRTVQVPRSGSVQLQVAGINGNTDTGFAFSSITGGLVSIPFDKAPPALNAFTIEASIDSARTLRTVVGRAGRVTICGTSNLLGAVPC